MWNPCWFSEISPKKSLMTTWICIHMHLEGIKNLPHEHVEVEHLLWILCINLLLLAAPWTATVLPTAGAHLGDLITLLNSKWWNVIPKWPRLPKMPNKCAFPWFIIHSSCSQITSCRSSFRNKRAANAKAPCLRKTLRRWHLQYVYSHTHMYTISYTHTCTNMCIHI